MNVLLIFNNRSSMAYAYCSDCAGRETNDDMESVKKALLANGHKVETLAFDSKSYGAILDMKGKIDVIFNVCDDGIDMNPGFEPHIPALLDVIGIPYTGSSYFAIALTNQKDLTKQVLMHNGIPTPKFQVFAAADEPLNKLIFPLIIKPAGEDASVGIKDDSVVQNEAQFRKKLSQVLVEYKQPALVEEYIEGREFSVAVMGNDMLESLPLSEIVFTLPKGKPHIVNYEAKWVKESAYYKGTMPKCPADVDKKLEQELKRMAITCFTLTKCQGYARVDFRLRDNVPYVLEINANPDISEDAGLANMARAAGMSYALLIEKIVQLALQKKKLAGAAQKSHSKNN